MTNQQLFEELRKLITVVSSSEDLEGLAKKYPALYSLYLKLATPERMEKQK